ncbi:MAG TPA: SH3 domain-containing protein [Chitinophagaceae bacterium]
MKKLFLSIPLFIGICLSITVNAQDWYVAAKSGLSIREKADAKATVLGKIPYGTKITVTYPEQIVNITTEGIVGAWAKVTYAGKTGYIVNSYLFPSPPPKPTVKTMKDYLAQLAAPFGVKLIVKSGKIDRPEEGGSELHKQLYKNGAEWHQFVGYEYNSNTYFIPEFTMTQAFLLLRMIPEFKDVWNEKDEFPTESKTIKKGDVEYFIKVEKEMPGDYPWVKMIKMEFGMGATIYFEMYQIDNQLVVFYGSGV